MKVVCSICLEEMHEDSCWMALRSCGHVFDKACIDLIFQGGCANKCPICSTVFENSPRPPFHLIQIYPSKASREEDEEHTNIKSELKEANQKVALLQSKLASTENMLDSSRQEHGVALSKLESTVNTITRLKMDNERLIKSNNDYLSSIEKLKTSYQIVASSFTKSPSSSQTPKEQQISFQDLFKVGKTVLNAVFSDPSSSLVNHMLQRDYADLKSKYQDAVNREKLSEMKVADLTARLQRSEATENLQDRHRLQKQLFDVVIEQNNLSNTVTNLKLEKQRLLSEKRAMQEDYKELQDAETVWITSNSHLQVLLKASKEDLIKMRALNHDYATEMIGLKEQVSTLREVVKKLEDEKLQCVDDIKQREAKMKQYKEEFKVLSVRENRLMEKLAVSQQPWQLFL